MTDATVLTPAPFVKLLGRYKAPKDFYDEVHRQALERVAGLKFRKEYRAEDLVDPDLWGDEVSVHILIGRCIAHLVVNGRLVLRFAGCPRCTNKRYLRI